MEPEPLYSSPRRVEAYLDQILVPLGHSLSPFHRDELRRELRAHLWERVDAYGELGRSEDEAVTDALRQFGGAEDFLRQWRQEWRAADRRVAWSEIWAATLPALRLSTPALLLAWLGGRGLGFLIVNALPHTYSGALLIAYGDALLAWAGAGFFWLSLGVGLIQSRRAPCRSGMGMFAALGAVISVGSGLYWVGTQTGLDRTIFGGAFVSLPLMAAAWMPTSCLAAALSGWTVRRRKGVRT